MKKFIEILFVLPVLANSSFAQRGIHERLSQGRAIEGDVVNYQISPDGATVVYLADQDTDEVDELYSVPVGGDTPVKLSSALPAGVNISNYEISPDGATVVYLADQDTAGVDELYSVPIGGGTPIMLNSSLAEGGNVSDYQICPDGSTVVYRADQDTDEVDELYSVPIGGGPSIKLNGDLSEGEFFGQLARGCDRSNFQFSPDGSIVVYRADQDTLLVDELYSVPIGGGPSIKLNDALPPDGDVLSNFRISPDGSAVVYVADRDTNNLFEEAIQQGRTGAKRRTR